MDAAYISLHAEIIPFVSRQKKITASRVLPHKPLNLLGIDQLDLVEIILQAEKKYNVIIPDEVPLRTVGDFVNFIYGAAILQQGR